MCHEIGSTTTRKLDPKNIGVDGRILSPCTLQLETCLGIFLHPPLPANVAKTLLPGEVLNNSTEQ